MLGTIPRRDQCANALRSCPDSGPDAGLAVAPPRAGQGEGELVGGDAPVVTDGLEGFVAPGVVFARVVVPCGNSSAGFEHARRQIGDVDQGAFIALGIQDAPADGVDAERPEARRAGASCFARREAHAAIGPRVAQEAVSAPTFVRGC